MMPEMKSPQWAGILYYLDVSQPAKCAVRL
jgi:hypothetical protein